MNIENGEFVLTFEGAEIRVNRIDVAEMLQQLLETKAPSGVYVAIRPDKVTQDRISDFFKSAEIPGLIAAQEYHVTLMYAPTQDLKDFDIDDDVGPHTTAEFGGYALYGDAKDCLVMKLDSKPLHTLHQKLADMGLKHTYEYSPHLTLSYKGSEVDVDALPKPIFEFHFMPELEVNAIDKDYKTKVTTV